MDNTELIGNEVINQEPLCNAIRKWFRENGTIAFEHGFKTDTIINKGYKYHISMCDDWGIYVYGKNKSCTIVLPWIVLPKQTIMKVVREINKYWNFCLAHNS